MPSCRRCGRDAAADARFCAGCGAPLVTVSLQEERKIVTVLFADLVGSTARAEGLDPEDVRAILSPFYARLRTELERFGGTVEKFIGDAVMAVFGAPVAHEDDPERAVRAALAIRDWVREEGELQVRIAVHTGEALVALGARPIEGEGMVAGDVVNTAARLQSAAPVNGVLVGEQTFRATERFVEYAVYEPVAAKGKAAPILAWEAVEARSRLGVDLSTSVGTPLVGREQELGLLEAALTRARDERAPQFVTLVGVPGIGKSRLLGELFGSVERGGTLTTWRQGRSLSYGEGVSYWALGEMVKAQAGILESDAQEEAGRKLREAVGRLIADEAEARWVESHLRPLAGMAADELAGDRRGEAFAAWRRFFEALAELRPLVLVFEDLHWADDGLLDFVDELVDWLTDVPVLLVATARPELLSRRPAWGGGKANAVTLSLAPLSDEDTARLVHTLLEQSVLPAEVQTALLDRAGGNPLYAEEFVRMVADRGLGGLELPESVQGIIAARLDGLEPEDKSLLQDAAVVGKVFWSGALAAIGGRDRYAVEQRLHALERRELVRRERRSSVAGESEYAFRHVLVRDVAYGAIPRAGRSERHAAAAAWIESLGRPDDQADLLAHHYLSALELARAAGTTPVVSAAAAAGALVAAGDRASGLNAFGSAVRFYDEALTLGADPADEPRVLLRLGSALHVGGDDRSLEMLERARDRLLEAGDAAAAADAGLLLADAWWSRGERDTAMTHLAAARELADRGGDRATTARVQLQVARYHMLAEEHEEAVRLAAETATLAESLGLVSSHVLALNVLGTARARTGDVAGIQDIERAIELGVAANDPEAARAYNNLAAVYHGIGDIRLAAEAWRAGRAAAARLGNATVGRHLEGSSIWAEYDFGHWDEALSAADAFLEQCERGSPHYLEGQVNGIKADILFCRDEVESARAAMARALELGRQAGDPQALGPSLGTAVMIETELGNLDEARLAARRLLDYRVATGTLAYYAAELGLVEELRDLLEVSPRNRWREAAKAMLAEDFGRAAEVYDEIGVLPMSADTRLRAARAAVAVGNRAEADEQLALAVDFYRRAGAVRRLRQAEQLLARTA